MIHRYRFSLSVHSISANTLTADIGNNVLVSFELDRLKADAKLDHVAVIIEIPSHAIKEPEPS